MSKVFIISDDLTGANATAVLLAKNGFRSATFLELNNYDKDANKELNVIAISTDSRGIKKEEAYDKVSKVVNLLKNEDFSFFSKRIDSTLRGNIGAEIDAVLDNLNEDYIAVVVCSFPNSKRCLIGGYLMVNSVPLEKTDVAKDPKCPVLTSYVPDIIKIQSKYDVGYIPLRTVLKGQEEIINALIYHKNNGNKIIVIDADCNENIDLIAKACKNSNLQIITVDPGPFTAAFAKEKLNVSKVNNKKKIVLTIGSVSNLTRKQIRNFKSKYDSYLVKVNSELLIYDETREKEIKRAADLVLSEINNYNIVGIVTTESENDVLDLNKISNKLGISEEEVSVRINEGLSEITGKVIDSKLEIIGGVYTSGGDVTEAICSKFKSIGIEIVDEILPLAVYGNIIKGIYNGMNIVTKGGLVGEEDALAKCIEYLQNKINK